MLTLVTNNAAIERQWRHVTRERIGAPMTILKGDDTLMTATSPNGETLATTKDVDQDKINSFLDIATMSLIQHQRKPLMFLGEQP